MKYISKRRIKDEKQEIVFKNFPLYEFWEKFALLLHIVGFILGAMTVFDLTIFHVYEKLLETLTLIIVGFILINRFSIGIIKKIVIRISFNWFWGESTIDTSYSIPLSIKSENENLNTFVEIAEEKKINTLTVANAGWYWNGLSLEFGWTAEVIIENEPGLKKFIDTGKNMLYHPQHVIYDFKKRQIQFIMNYCYEDGSVTEFIGKIDVRKKSIQWYGRLPDSPIYGTWNWKE